MISSSSHTAHATTSPPPPPPPLLAATRDETFPPINVPGPNVAKPNFPRRTLLSADGTTLVTHSEDLRLRTHVLPPTLLSPPHPQTIGTYTSSAPTFSHAFALPHYFDLSDPASTHLLLSTPDLPVRLANVLDFTHLHASYQLVHEPTERLIAPHSLAFQPDGQGFIGGWKENIGFWDLLRDGEGPVTEFGTKKSAGGGVRGIVMALAVEETGTMVAAGGSGRGVAVWDGAGRGQEMLDLHLGGEGKGATQLEWVGDTYLVIGERGSDCLDVLDVRMGKSLTRLVGRKGRTMLRMAFDVVRGEDGVTVLAGGTDGVVRVWNNVTDGDGQREAESRWKAADDKLSTVKMHPCGEVMLTASGSRTEDTTYDSDVEDGPGSPPRPAVGDGRLQAWAVQ